MNLIEYGAAMKRLRGNKNYGLKTVVGSHSLSSLSKFEHGLNNPSVISFLDFINHLNVHFFDFMIEVNDADADFLILYQPLKNLLEAHDVVLMTPINSDQLRREISQLMTDTVSKKAVTTLILTYTDTAEPTSSLVIHIEKVIHEMVAHQTFGNLEILLFRYTYAFVGEKVKSDFLIFFLEHSKLVEEWLILYCFPKSTELITLIIWCAIDLLPNHLTIVKAVYERIDGLLGRYESLVDEVLFAALKDMLVLINDNEKSVTNQRVVVDFLLHFGRVIDAQLVTERYSLLATNS
ncbi:hypothetical protein H9L19_05115 [Weissella diestrammenae]|uniref:Rgg/GadR/MutR family transcriptional regulator n=1 Tax=Weissella diestrammenae TaxID=1162633 RepID=A0A7G9T3X0_9LACO|nr:hypothetical protein [Weissella diestrammenae]MCM0582120.1 hypothetical protein [Weissella diestrammenae]QNN74795.1 hypothetical protein H9L19_05115 [Weissella diestrammenae]